MSSMIQISEIKYERAERLRKTLDKGKIEKLAESIKRQLENGHIQGLTHPIVLTRDGKLVAGEHRIEAFKLLGKTEIWFEYTDMTDPVQLILMEIEENTCRAQMDWRDECRATLIAKEAGASQPQIAAAMGVTRERVSQKQTTAEHLDDPRVSRCDKETTAYRRANAIKQRKKAAIEAQSLAADTSPVQCVDFRKWAKSYHGPKFNFIHCDFPYGINSQDSGLNPSGYHDSRTTYAELCATLHEHLDNFCARDAHMIFWCATGIEDQHGTFQFLKTLPGFTFVAVPLIWHKPSTGIPPNALRQPRQCYEVAFFGWRGNATILQVRDNIRSASKTDGGHPHEKPVELLKYWFEMFVDHNTAMLDPTCGGATSLEAAMTCAAGRVLGLELSEETANKARARLGGIKVNFKIPDAVAPLTVSLEDLGLLK